MDEPNSVLNKKMYWRSRLCIKLGNFLLKFKWLYSKATANSLRDYVKVNTIALALSTLDGRKVLAAAMIDPIKWVGSKCIPLDKEFSEAERQENPSYSKCFDLIDQGIENWEKAMCIKELHKLCVDEDLKRKIELGIWNASK